MCVIFIVDKARPTAEMVDRAWDWNDDGGGVAWREGEGDNREVVWKKGLDFEEMKELIKTLPLPFVAHFRVASCGGVVDKLTHPFPIDKRVSLALEGRTKGRVLFHNGDWKDWAEAAREAAIRSNTPIPPGRWNDTRTIAWLMAIYGIGFMEFLPDQRGVAFGPKDSEVFTGKGWHKINDVWCSNDVFLHKSRGNIGAQAFTMCRNLTCVSKDVDEFGYCPKHQNGRVDPTVKVPGTGGSSNVSPFRQATQGNIISLEVAERLHAQKNEKGERLISKNMIKAIRLEYDKLHGKDPKKVEKARKNLLNITNKVNFSGPVH